MAGTTSKGIPYPQNGDAPNVAVDIQNVADSVDTLLNNYLDASAVTAKGDVLAGTGPNTVVRVAIGSNNTLLTADSAETAGVKWTSTITSPTISSPTVSGLTLSDSSIVFEGSTADANETTLTVVDPTADRTVTIPDATTTLVGTDVTQTLTNKTLTDPALNYGVLKSPEEVITISATAATGTVDVDLLTSSFIYYTSDASGNWTFNFRGDGSTTLDSLLSTGQSISCAFMVTNGATAYYASAFQVDGSAVTPKWQGASAPAAGNVSSVDSYAFTIVKTGSATFEVFASVTQFA